MSWNYRVMKRRFPSILHEGSYEVSYGLYEVFYDDSGNVDGWTEESLIGYFESPKELITAVEMMLNDIIRFQEILDYE